MTAISTVHRGILCAAKGRDRVPWTVSFVIVTNCGYTIFVCVCVVHMYGKGCVSVNSCVVTNFIKIVESSLTQPPPPQEHLFNLKVSRRLLVYIIRSFSL